MGLPSASFMLCEDDAMEMKISPDKNSNYLPIDL